MKLVHSGEAEDLGLNHAYISVKIAMLCVNIDMILLFLFRWLWVVGIGVGGTTTTCSLSECAHGEKTEGTLAGEDGQKGRLKGRGI